MGGIFNIIDPLFKWQLYIWSWVAFIILTICCHLIWYYSKWMPFKPLHGLYYAFKAGSYAAFVMNPSLRCELISEREGKCIFDYSKVDYRFEYSNFIGRIIVRFKKIFFNYASLYLDDIGKWKAFLYKIGKRNMDVEIARKLQNYEWEESPSVIIQGINTDIIIDGDNWTFRPSPQHKAIEAQTDHWNEINKDDEIHSYSKLQRYYLLNKLTPPLGVKDKILVPWIRIDSAFPINLEDNEMSGARRQAAHEMNEEERNPLAKYYLPILGGGIGLGVLMYLLRFISFITTKH